MPPEANQDSYFDALFGECDRCRGEGIVECESIEYGLKIPVMGKRSLIENPEHFDECDRCRGTGIVDGFECTNCDGFGLVQTLEALISRGLADPGLTMNKKCIWCNGSGVVPTAPDEECPMCSGMGIE